MKVSNVNVLNVIPEIIGFSSDGVEAKGILNERVSLKVKHYVRCLLKELNQHKDLYIESYREWVKESGSDDFSRFISENLELANAKVDVGDYPISIDDLDFESEYGYPFFMSIVIDKEG